jgi:hypothetical protein
MNPGCVFLSADYLPEKTIIPFTNFVMSEMGFRHDHTDVFRPIAQASKIITRMTHLFEYLGPFRSLQGDSIGPRKTK